MRRLVITGAFFVLGCGMGWYYWDTTVEWVNPLPVDVSSGMDYPVTVAVAGAANVDHVNVHWSRTGDPRYAPADLEEVPAQAGPPGQFNFVLNFSAKAVTTIYITAHARVNGWDYYSDVRAVRIVPGPPYVNWTTMPPEPMAAGIDHAVEYTVTGGAAVNSVRVQWATRGWNPSSNPDGWTVGSSGVPGLFADTLNLSPSADCAYQMCVRADVDGSICYSPIISRLVELTPPADAYEPNDSFTNAAFLVGSGGTVTVHPYLYPGGDCDYFWVSSGSGVLNISLTSLPQDYDLFLYDSNYELEDYSTQYGTTPESISAIVNSGTHYIVVRGYREAYDDSPYTLSVDVP
jgi:hypothetical protein